MFGTLLIANRGEIACRVIRTARRMGITTVAVYSDADADALHVATADQAVRIGPPSARESYLNIPAIIEAAQRTGAEAIHPGYGFLSENPAFAEACAEAGLIFVGPPAAAMRAMGSKAAAKALMEESGVPLLPGYHGERQEPDFLAAAAARVGFPVVIKAVAGGGGRGMRIVGDVTSFPALLSSARQEAASAFGDERVLVERYLDQPRHIEVQVFADVHGNAVHLFERDCSAQRRHQKVVEEAPAPGLDASWREAMGTAAVKAAQAVDYVGAGTVEFVVDTRGFYFLEMNTRLQVEHPVTEMVTGFDLVEWQLRVAAGEALPARQEGIALNGHAMEVRIYAEDPARNFAPSIGRITTFRMPEETPWTRIDTGVRQGDEVSIHYDAMIAKLICHGADREEAIARLRYSLGECEIAGVVTNVELLERILATPAFAAGGIDTGFIERHAETLLAPQPAPSAEVLAAVALGVLVLESEQAGIAASRSADPYSPWHARTGWWLNASPERVLRFTDEHGEHPVRVRREGDDAWRIVADTFAVLGRGWRASDGRIGVDIDGIRTAAGFDRNAETITLRLEGGTWRFRLPDPAAAAEADDESGGRLVAPIPGQVTEVLAEPGHSVKRGDILVILEAMKTVFRLGAPSDGTIAVVACRAGEQVEEGQLLVGFAGDDESA